MKASKSFDVALLFRALADHTWLRLLNLMGDDEVCVCFLVEALGVTQPKISRHLAYLRRAGIVIARCEGKWMHYRLEKPQDLHALVIAIVVGSGIMGERLAQGNAAVALLANSLAIGAGLYALIVMLGPVSGAHFNPVVSGVSACEGRLTVSYFCVYVLA